MHSVTDATQFFKQDMRLHVLADSIAHIVWSTDEKGNFDFANARWTEFTHQAPIAGDGSLWLDFIHDDDRKRVSEKFCDALRSGESFEFEYRLRRWDGLYRWHLSRGVPYRDSDGRVVRWVGTATDVDDLKQAETALKKSEEQYRHAQKMEAVGRLAGGVAHDFNNMLTVIKGHSEFLSRALPLEGDSREDIDQITHAAQRASRLTRQLLAFSRQQVMEKHGMDVNTLLRDFEKMLVRVIGEDVNLDLSLHAGAPFILADSGQVEQAVMNLVVNARDAMPDGGDLQLSTRAVTITAEGTARYSQATAGKYLAIGVRDTGTGIDPELLPRIFEPFFTTKDAGRGTGLGLATVYGIAQQLGGFVDVVSAPGEGASFTLFLPEVDPQIAESIKAEAEASVRGDEMILVVEDQDEVRAVARRILITNGYRVMEARNGNDALSIFEDARLSVDLVLTDAVMPQMGGPDLVRALRVNKPTLPVVMVSGYTDRELVTYGARELNVPFLPKPFRADDLLRTVRTALDKVKS